MPDSVMVIDASGSGAPPVVREATPEEQAQIDADRAAAAAHVEYVGARNVRGQVRTTDDVPLEVFRFTTAAKHVYRATLRMTAIDAESGATKDSEVRMVFKGLASSVSQVGATAVLSAQQDASASSWAIQPSVVGRDLVISVKGAAGKTVDWALMGEIGTFAPEGLE